MAWDDQDDGLQQFLAKAGNHRILTRTEEYETARRARAGDGAARDKLIEHNIRLVLSIAQHFRNRGLGAADLISEGIIGLHIAVDKFDPELGYRFTTYATWWVRKALQRGVAAAGADTIRLPPGVRQRRGKALAYLSSHPNADLNELASALEEEASLIAEALGAASVVASIHDSGGEPSGISESYADPNADDPAAVADVIGADLAEALETLDDFDRHVIEFRFGLFGEALAVSEISKRLGKPEHVVQAAQRRALASLRTGILASTR